ncbi:MAG TPA: hypothetical protein VII63_00595 [Caulobacteraceae bacterium]
MAAVARQSAQDVDPRSREIAHTLARQSGLSLKEWTARLMVGEVAAEAALEDEVRSGDDPIEREEAMDERAASSPPADAVGESALESLAEDVAAPRSRSATTSAGADETMDAALTRLVEAGREQVSIAARFEGAMQGIAAERTRMAKRLGGIQADGARARSVAAVLALEARLGDMADDLYQGESWTGETIDDITETLRRIEAAESRAPFVSSEPAASLGADLAQEALEDKAERLASPAPGPREELDDDFAGHIETTQAGFEARISAAVEDLLGGVKRDLARTSEQIHAAEQRSRELIEEMGREAANLHRSLVDRLGAAERLGAGATEQAAAEVSRISRFVEARLARADTVQVAILAELSGEIARIGERLAERIASPGWRSAEGVELAGEELARTSEWSGHERTARGFAERSRLREERIARILDEGRDEQEGVGHPRRAAGDSPSGMIAETFDEQPIFGDDPFIGFPPLQAPPRAAGKGPAFSREDLDLADSFPAGAQARGGDAPTAPAPGASPSSREPASLGEWIGSRRSARMTDRFWAWIGGRPTPRL